jgi:hypothetical protein
MISHNPGTLVSHINLKNNENTIRLYRKQNLIHWGILTKGRRVSVSLLFTLKSVKYHRIIVGEIT